MAAITLEELLKEVGVHPEKLNEAASDDHLLEIALFLTSWRTVASHLDLGENDLDDAEQGGRKVKDRSLKALQIWKGKFGFKATYKKLVDVLLSLAMADVAEKVCRLLKEDMSVTNGSSGIEFQSEVNTTNGGRLSMELQLEGSNTSATNGAKTGLTDALSKQPEFNKLSLSEQENLMIKLYDDERNMKLQFAGLVTKTRESVEKRTTVEKFAGGVLALGAYEPVREVQGQSLLEDHSKEINSAETIAKIFTTLNAYWNYLTYEILEHIIDHFGDGTDKERLKSYNQDLQNFCKRRIFELPPESGNDNTLNPKQEKFTVKLGIRKDSTYKDLLQIRGRIAKILKVNPAVLVLSRVDEGCVELTFLIPRFVAQELFPLSCEQTSALSKDASVTRLECGHYVFENTSKNYTGDAATQSTVSLELEGQQEKSQLRKEPYVHQIVAAQARHPGQYTHPPLCPIDKGNIFEISGCLQKLDETHIFDLGMTLGISHSELTEMMDSPSFAEDVITAWLQREEQRGAPSWVILISALTDLLVEQEGMSRGTTRTTAEAVQVSRHPKHITNIEVHPEFERIVQEKKILMMELQSKERECHHLTEMGEKQASILEKKISGKQKEIEALQKELWSKESDLQSIQQEARRLQEEFLTVLAELREKHKEIIQLRKEKKTLSFSETEPVSKPIHLTVDLGSEKTERKEQLVDVKEESKSKSQQIESCNLNINCLNEEIEVLSSLVQEKEAAEAQLQSELQTCQQVASGPGQLLGLLKLTIQISKLEHKLQEAEYQKLQVELERENLVQEVKAREVIELQLHAQLDEPPKVTNQPRTLSKVPPGNPVVFTVQATGTEPLRYNWQWKPAAEEEEWQPCPAEWCDGATLTIPNVEKSNEGSYCCVVSNCAGTVISKPAQLSVAEPPRITTHPHKFKDAVRGKPAKFTIQATGTEPLSYLWQWKPAEKGGSEEWQLCYAGWCDDGALTIPSVQKSNEGNYRCVISNCAGSQASNPAELEILEGTAYELLRACHEGNVVRVRRLLPEIKDPASVKNFWFEDDEALNPLHYSCRHGWLDVTRSLVEQYHYYPESRNKSGNTPLHEACRKGHVDIVRYLVSEQGCSATCQNKMGDTPLHMACRWNVIGVVQFLLSTGRVNPQCKNANNESPVQLTDNYALSKLFAGFGKKNLETNINVFVFGNPAVGKSTLVKVIEHKVTSRFGALAGQFRNVTGVELKTAGISTVTIQNRRLGRVTIYDLAGQFEYYSSHDALVGNLVSSSAAIFIVVIKVSETEAEMIQTLRYWISFIGNCCSRVEATAHLMVVGSWADKAKETGENINQKWSNIEKACISCISFGFPLHFIGFTYLDCRKLASSGLDKIYDMIGSSCTALRVATEHEHKEIIYPHLLHAFISTKLGSEVACSVRELCTLIIEEDDALLPTESNLLSPLLSSLSSGGHLLYLPNKEDFEAGWVVINKQAVLSEINGTIFAPEYFKQHHDIATSTGVVPKSKIADVFAEKYNIDMILGVLTLFEFCQKIKDSFTLSLIASSDPSREVAAALTTGDESSESYYFFPGLVQVEHSTDVQQSSDPRQYQCGWCLQCSKEGQYLTPRFLHVLLLRLAFSFALAPDSSQQDEDSPVLRRRCAVWKNGIQWLEQDGVYSRVEVVEQNQTVLLLMCCPKKQPMACVKLRSVLVHVILSCQKELCPGVDTVESLIDPSNLFQHQIASTRKLTTYSMAVVAKAVKEGKSCAVDQTGEKSLDLEIALYFEPYHGMHTRLIDQLFDEDFANQEVDDDFLHDLAVNIHTKLIQQVPIKKVLQMLNIFDERLFFTYCDQYPDEKDSPIMRCLYLLLTWKNCDTGGSTYRSLRTTLDKYSIFCGRNPMQL